jgi:hypothetical protein
VQTTKTTTKNNIEVITNVSGAPINIAIGADFLKPVAETFLPITEGVQQGIKTLSNQAQSIAEFTERSNLALSSRQADLEKLIKIMLAVTVAAFGFQFIRTQRGHA